MPGLLVEGLLFGFGGVGGGGANDDGGIFVGQFAFTSITEPSGHFLVVKGVCFCGHDGSEGFVLQSIDEVTLFPDDEPFLAKFFKL